MSHTADVPPDVPSALGELLALLHRADAAFDSVAVSYRVWRHEVRAAAAWRSEVERNRRRGASITSYASQDESVRPVETERVLRIWLAGDQAREEHQGDQRDSAYAVRDGDAWWAWDKRNGASSNQGDLTLGRDVGQEVSLMLDPTALLGALRFIPTGRGTVADRETFSADAVPRLTDPQRPPRAFELHQLGSGADRYALEVDAERGVLLQATAVHDGEAFHRITTDWVVFDQPIDPERFVFVAPAGEDVQPARGGHRVRHVALTEVQQLAAFVVLIPQRIPPDWKSRYAFIEASVRPPSAAAVSITYHAEDGHQGVSLTQYAAGDQDGQYALMIEHGGWQTIQRNDITIHVRALGGQAQAQLEHDGTFVSLISDTLTAEELTALAESLKPAPTATSF